MLKKTPRPRWAVIRKEEDKKAAVIQAVGRPELWDGLWCKGL